MGKTSISWCDYSWPVVNGCRRVSPGCGGPDGGGCYAERLAATRLKTHPKYAGLATIANGHAHWTGETRLWEPDLSFPRSITKRSRIFVANMGDLWYEGVSDATILRVLLACRLSPQHHYLFLTKRAERCYRFMTDWRWQRNHDWSDGKGLLTIPHNWWFGISAENHDELVKRWYWISQLKAQVLWISYEPALGWLNLYEAIDQTPCGYYCDESVGHVGHRIPSWLVAGGESGPGYRAARVEWLEDVGEQCTSLRIPLFTKQDSHRYPGKQGRLPDALWHRKEFPHV